MSKREKAKYSEPETAPVAMDDPAPDAGKLKVFGGSI